MRSGVSFNRLEGSAPFPGNGAIKPAPGDIARVLDAFRDLLKIRASSTLFRPRTTSVRRGVRDALKP